MSFGTAIVANGRLLVLSALAIIYLFALFAFNFFNGVVGEIIYFIIYFMAVSQGR